MKWWMLLVVVLAVVLWACAPAGPTCSDPYIPNGNTCCLDKDSNTICDVDETTPVDTDGETAVSCDLCPPRFVTQKEEVIVYRYICTNGTVADEASGCADIIRSNADQFTLTTAQDDSLVTEFETRAACRGQYPAAEVHLGVTDSPQVVVFQARSSPTGGYEDIGSINSSTNIIDDEYFYIGFCNPLVCHTITDAQLPTHTAHVVRAKLIFAESNKFTKDVLIDPTPEGEHGKKEC